MARIDSLAMFLMENLSKERLAYLCETILLDMHERDIYEALEYCDYEEVVHRCDGCDGFYSSAEDLVHHEDAQSLCPECEDFYIEKEEATK